MKIAYRGATLITSTGIRREALVIDTRRGIILPSDTPPDKTVEAAGLYLYPGLINAHDHLELNHYPRSKYREVYTNASQWAAEMSARLDTSPFAELSAWPLSERCRVGGVKNQGAGVTTVIHHNPLHRPLTRRDFPVHVVRRYGWTHSLYLTPPAAIQASYQRTRRGLWMIHLAEGTDSDAEKEISHLSDLGCLSAKTLLIHGVALSPDADVIRRVAGLVWCPSTNLYLLGQTAEVRAWYQAGKLALGSDSRLTADGDLLDELRAAHATGQLTPEELFHIVTDMPARLFGFHDRGDLQPGKRADVLALHPAHPDPYLALIAARREHIAWRMRGGHVDM